MVSSTTTDELRTLRLSPTVRELVAGTVGGCAGIFAGHPLDTVRVRMQTARPGAYRHMLDCGARIVREEGALALFRGLVPPVVGNAPLNAVAFGAVAWMNRFQDRHFAGDVDLGDKNENGGGAGGSRSGDVRELHLRRLLISGMFSGFLTSLVTTPVELAKCRLQVHTERGAAQRYAGSIDYLRQLLAARGLRGPYWGLCATLARDVPAWAAYFVTYDYVRWWLRSDPLPLSASLSVLSSSTAAPRVSPDSTSFSTGAILTAGACAGVAAWAVSYPMDVVKSIVQTMPESTSAAELRISHIIARERAANGWNFCWRGLWPTLIRAAPTSAVVFLGYEHTLRLLDAN
jgi:solute carrier family 25 carnitine/acylcarnitine transporter 20/29